MPLNWWLTYLATCIVFSLSPGSGAVNTTSLSISHGFRTALVGVVGLQVGLAVHVVCVGIGLGALLSHSPRLFAALKLLGALYLIWLGIKQWRDSGALTADKGRAVSHSAVLRQSVLVNLTNPKSILFLAALFPQFIVSPDHQALQYTILAVTTLFVDALVMLFYAGVAKAFARWVSTPYRMTLVNRLFGTLFILIGIVLALPWG